ncbi:MAG: inositol monophosphatase family protein [Actinomycetota bacterium]
MDATEVLDVFDAVARAVSATLADVRDWGESGARSGQYLADVLADDAALPILRSAGFGIVSEESGIENPNADVIVCLDPLDGSTNASRGIPHFATSLCAVDADGPWVAMVVHQAIPKRWWAVRGEGAHSSNGRLERADGRPWSEALVAISGPPPRNPGWGQFRALGASAIDLCLVAEGTVDAFIDMSPSAHGVWDYAAGLLICREAGIEVCDAEGRELIILDHHARRTPVAASQVLLPEVMRVRTSNR